MRQRDFPVRVSIPAFLAAAALLAGGPLLAQPSQSVRRTPVVTVAERVSPSVVNISAEATVREVDPFFRFFYGPRRRTQSLGSGLIVNRNGIVVTNAHVIEGASRIVVTTLEGRELEADVLGSDRDSDLAVLKVDARNLPAVPLGNSSDLLIGETVVAIGNPFGLTHTVTTGVLSARGRTVPSERGDHSLRVALRAVRPPEGLGLRFLESSVGIEVAESRNTLVVRRVEEGSLADRRGLRPGDTLLGANGQEVDTTEELGREVLRGIDRGGLLLAVGRGRYIYNLDFPLE